MTKFTSTFRILSSAFRGLFGRRALCSAAVLGLSAAAATAAQQDGSLRMEVITAYNFVVDSNIASPAGKSPSAAHLGVRLYNDGPTALTNVVVNIGTLTDPLTSTGTPGVFEERTVNVTGAKAYSGTFSLIMPGGPSDAVRVIQRIEPGEYITQYFFVVYPLLDSLGRAVTGEANVTSDDLWLEYDIWASASEGANTRRVDRGTRVTMRNEISAMANKIWPNTTSKVPTPYLDAIEASLGWRPQEGVPRISGANITEGIWYDLGNVGAGFDNDGDGVPDRNAWLQPVGDPAQFSPLAARMVKCYGIVIVKLNDGSEQLIPFEDRLYFEKLPANNTGAIGLVFYEFLPLNASLPSSLTPYQEVASGYDNEKFNSDYGTVTGTAAPENPEAEIVKTGPVSRQIGENADYTITATNTGEVQFGWPDLGLPAVIEDVIPAGLEFVSGTADTVNNVTNPAGGQFEVFYSADNGSSWTTTEPVPASTVNRLRWVLDRALAPGDTATVTFSANVPASFTGSSFINLVLLKTGTESEVDRDDWTTIVTGINSVGDFVWRDLNRDGIQDGGAETGIANIGVSLFVDSNGNDALDAGEPLYATTSTDSSGLYLFSDLPDGKYIAVVDALDTDLPEGFTLKAGVSPQIAVDLDSANASGTPVSVLTADWPFIEALEVTKTVSPTTYLEGDLITYDIHLDNHMETLQVSQPSVQTTYATSTVFDKSNATGKATEAEAAGAPNESFARIDWNANSDRLVSAGITPILNEVGTITKVELLVRGYMSIPLVNDALDIEIGHAGRAISVFASLTTADMNALVGVNQDLVIDVTSASAGWTWAEAQSLAAALVTTKSQGGDDGDYFVDSIGFRITTDTLPITGTVGPNTITQWPLVDSYDPAKLEYVDSSFTPDLVSPPGTIEWFNLGPVNAGTRKTITVTFRAKAPMDINSDGQRDPMTATNSITTVGSSSGIVPLFQSGLPAGHDDSSVDVTINPAGRIGDFVYWDVNANSTFDAGDVPIRNVIVQLFQDTGAGFISTGRAQITDVNGFYEFGGLTDGTYQIRITTNTGNDLFTLPWTTFTSYQKGVAGTNQTGFVQGDTVILNNADTITTNDFNLLQDFGFDSNVASLISGILFRDWNGNGIQDPGDEPLAGYTVTLSGGTTSSTTTNAQGFYQFNNITTAGNHTVTVTSPPAGHVQTLDPDATLNDATTISVVLGNAYLDRDFAYQPAGLLSLGDTVYYDWNGNATQDSGEPGIPNITMHIYEDANGDGIINTTDALIATTVTNSTGFYQFTGLAAGNYIVRVVTSDPDFPANVLETEDYDGVQDNQAQVNLTVSLDTVDFGYEPFGTADLGNLVWLDTNNNGIRDAGESGINGVTVELYRAGQTPAVDAPTGTSITSGGGFYGFSNLPAGDYFVHIPAASFGTGEALESYPWSSTTTSTSDDLIDNDDNGIQTTGGDPVSSPLITLSSGQSNPTVDFGFTGTGTAGDFVFYDINGDGEQDFTDPGISGVTVRIFIDADMDGQPDNGTPLATTVTSDGTDGNPVGYYQFTNLVPGSYFIDVDTTTLPGGVTYTSDPDRSGIPVGEEPLEPVGDDADSYVMVSIGSSYTGADFGYQPTGAIGDFVWLDLNQDGVADPGEPGLVNVEIEITDGTDTFTVFTDPDGFWSAIVPDGTWSVTVVATNFNSGSPLFGLAPSFDADGTGTANTTTVVLTAGVVTTPANLDEGNLGIDFGYLLDGAYGISGTVLTNDTRVLGTADDIDDFYDDGVDMDAGPLDETELEGIVVYLYTDSGTFLGTQVTDSNGFYAFSGLPSDTYRVIIGTTDAPLNSATLTTTVSNNPATTSVDDSSGTSVIQTVVVNESFVVDVDFAFIQDEEYDYGDLPMSYGMTTLGQDGARHIIPSGGSTRYLGTAPDAEINGLPDSLALGDDLSGADDEDGVTPLDIATWAEGAAGGSIEVNVTGSGWLVGWIDWNNDGDFLDTDEFIVSQAVSTGTQVVDLDIPAGVLSGASQSWLSRFRLVPNEPEFPLFSYTGVVTDGEVEDHLFEKIVDGSIGDFVWVDLNGDGVIDANEDGIGGVTIELRDDLGGLVATQTTSNGSQDVDGDGVIDAVGYYRFRGLGAGTYTVTIPTPPAGYTPSYDEDGVGTPSTTDVVLAADVQHLTADFGYEPLVASISGQVRVDVDADGDFLDPDDGASFVRIQLWTDPNGNGDPADGVQVGEMFTDANGDYLFSDVPTGQYTVVKTNPTGSTSTADADGGNLDRIAVVMSGTDVTERDFLITSPSSIYAISGTSYQDNAVSDDGVLGPDDLVVPGVRVGLFLDRNGDGIANDGDPEIAFTFTNSSGFYSFNGLQPGTYVVSQDAISGSTAIWDAQGAPDDRLISVAIIDADVIERDFLGDNLLGSLSGTVRADTNGDGNPDITLEGVVLSLLDASGSPVLDGNSNAITTTTIASGAYSFANLPQGSYQVAETQPIGYGSLSDSDGGNPDLVGDQQLIAVVNGAETPGNDFLEFLQSCPDLWTDWQAKWDAILVGQTGPLQNPDGDRYNNLIEYAFCLPPHLGVRKPFCLAPSISVTGGIDGVFSRTAIGGAKDVTYVLEWTAELAAPTIWTGSVILDAGNTTFTNDGNGKETVRIPDLETFTGLAGAGFVRIRVELDNGVVQETAHTDVLGWVQTDFATCCTSYCNPFLECAVFTGTIDSVDGQNLVLSTSATEFDLGMLLEPGVAYYIEVETGDFAGHRFDVTAGGVETLTLANDPDLFALAAPFNTVAGAAPALLAGDRIALHVAKTLDQLFPPSGFAATGSQSTADRVQLNVGGQWSNFWLYDDAAGAGVARWVSTANSTLDDLGDTVIPPGRGIFFDNRSQQASSILAYGEVREHDFVYPLAAGHNLVGGGYPVDQTPVGPLSRELNHADGFFGSRDIKTADSIFQWKPDIDPLLSGYDSYFLLYRASPLVLKWVKQNDASLLSRDSELLFDRDRSVILRVTDTLPEYRIPAPWLPDAIIAP